MDSSRTGARRRRVAAALLRLPIYLVPILACGCALLRQSMDPNLDVLYRQYGAGTIPFEDQLIFFNDKYMDDDAFARAFVYLKKYGMKELDLNGRQISDRSVPLLVQLKTVRDLNLAGTDLTLDGLKQLRHLPRLEWLSVAAGQLGEAELAELRAAMPKVKVEETLLVHDAGRSERAPSSGPTSEPAI
jgi:hypothetical protein